MHNGGRESVFDVLDVSVFVEVVSAVLEIVLLLMNEAVETLVIEIPVDSV